MKWGVPLIKTLARSIKQEKENFRIPHSVQDVIPIRRIWPDGIFRTGNAYSRSYRLTDINYAIASKADKTAMLLDYSELLNALDSGACAKITINNRRVDRRQFEQELLIRPQEDKLNEYRQEYNDMLRSHAASNNNVVQERYLTISAHKRSVDEARAYFQRMGGEVTARLGQLSSQAEELDASARLQILRDFFKAGQPAVVPFNMERRAKRGHDFRDWFCPDSLEFYADFFKSDVRWGRVLYLQDYASFIKDDFIMELCGLDRSMMVSIDILPVPTDEAVRDLPRARPQGCSPARTPAGGPAGACCQRPWRPADTPVQGEKPRQAAHTTGHGARPQGRQAHSKGRTSAGKDAAGNPHGHPANRTCGETGGTAGKAGCKSCAENSKGGRTGAGQYCQSLYCGSQKPCSCAGSGRRSFAVHRSAHLFDCSGGRFGVRYFLFG